MEISAKSIGRLALQVGTELASCRDDDRASLSKPVDPPSVAVVEIDGGRIRTREPGHGPGVHLSGEGWSETKNAVFIRATSQRFTKDPSPEPPACFLSAEHVAKLTEQAVCPTKTEDPHEPEALRDQEQGPQDHTWKPQRLFRTVISSMQNSHLFGAQMLAEAKRRRFDASERKAFLGDGLKCNWTIQESLFGQYTPILDFTHAVTYLFSAATIILGKSDEAWAQYTRWMTMCWQGEVTQIIQELKIHQTHLGLPPEDAADDDPREKLRQIIGYLQNNAQRMKYAIYRQQGLPITTAWMESLVKEMNYRVKGTEMFWNNPQGAEAILQIRAAALSEDDRLASFLATRPGSPHVRRSDPALHAMAA